MPPKTIDQDQADENAVAPLDERIEQLMLASGGALVASIVAELTDIWKHLPKPFAQATNAQQQDVFRRFEALAKELVGQTALAIANHDADRSIVCIMGDAKVGSDIKCDLKLAPQHVDVRDAAILFLAHARGRQVVVRMASADEYDTQAAIDPSEPDQADMGFEAGTDEISEEASPGEGADQLVAAEE